MYIHLNNREGMFTLVDYNKEYITIKTKHTEPTVYPVSEFKCIAGGIHNLRVSQEEMNKFLSVVAPEKVSTTTADLVNLLSRLSAIEDSSKELKEYKEMYDKTSKKLETIQRERLEHGRKLYADLIDLPILKNLQIEDGIKFIIQESIGKEGEYRFCFDPYRLVDNFHSSLSDLYRSNDYYTINGGWIKIIDNTVTLYAKSGDYGVYDDAIGISTAKVLFPNKNIESYAGKSWETRFEEDDDLPF